MDEVRSRGRPAFSPIRDNIVELLHFQGRGYGYDLYKKYVGIFHKTTIRSIYYHLNKGVSLGVFKINKVEDVKGDYSWGEGVRRVLFELGPSATPKGDVRVLKRLKEYNRKNI
tara:strand:+ start:65 stop:403 length:339 start_codon:yes stop_codon:yes gene_type:complete